ncbi:uncharacterized protein G2W53_021703 [Senna tora]|uniref:Uncharacterized protein n=1 Tax=Senna tora TaxID=362788 RepID=A0A834TTA2_9FABA|nr:uncharacterized protein G2W53_021703 [Senna tora]
MDALGSFFHAEESVESLKLKLLHTKLKFIATKNLTMQQLNLLHQLSQDRDRIRHKLHRALLQFQFHHPSTTTSFLLYPHHHHRHVISHISSSSSRSPLLGFTMGSVVSTLREDLVIQRLVRGKVLPEKGKLLESVMEAGPLLHSLLVAGPLPTWRNPPPPRPMIGDVLPPFAVRDPNGGLKFTPNDLEEDQALASKRQRLF